MAQRRGFQMVGSGGENGGGGGGGGGGQYYYNNSNNNNNNETTYYTKIFVGGLAWETQRETMRHYFEQFGEIQEAVVITDKNTGRSKGYGFVTFRDPESAMRACQNPSPVIDGRRANCNLASLGAHKTHPPSPQHGRFRPVPGLVTPTGYQGSSSSSTYFHQPTSQYAFPYSAYGYSAGYSQDTMYPMNYYSVYGGQQFQPYYAAAAAAATTGASSGSPGIFQNFYPYYAQYAQSGQSHHGFGVQYPQMLQYPYLPQQHYASTGILSLPSSTSIAIPTTSTAALTSTSVAVPVASQSQATGTASEQSSST